MTTHPLRNYFLIEPSCLPIEEANQCIEIYPTIIVLKCGLNVLFILPKSKHFISFFNCFAVDLFTLTSNKCRKVCKVDGNPQPHSRDWSMYSDILNQSNFGQFLCLIRALRVGNQFLFRYSK